MILRCLHMFYGGLRQNLHYWQMYCGVPHVNRGETGKVRVDAPESGWIHLKVGIQCALFSVGNLNA